MSAAELTARLLAGKALGQEEPQGFAELLHARRLGAELSALPDIAASGLARTTLRRLAVERGRVGAAAATRAPVLERAGRALAAAGLVAWLYKGEAFIRLCHGDPSRRPMSDLDLVVPAADRARAGLALREAGFTETPHATTALHDVFVDERARGAGHPHGVALELHGDVFPPPHPFALDLEGVLERSRPSELEGLRLPAPEDALVLHAFHLLLFEQDSRKSWLALRDIALLGRVADLDLASSRAGRLGMLPVLSWALSRAERWAGGPPAWAGGSAPPRPSGGQGMGPRRRLALHLAASELESALMSEALEPPPRALSRRLSAALWQPRVTGTLRALLRGLFGPGGGGLGRRASRYLAAWRRRQG